MPKCVLNKVVFNNIEIALRHGCSPAKLLDTFRTPFPRNTSGWLPLNNGQVLYPHFFQEISGT